MRRYLRSEHGGAGPEYALLLALFAATVAVAAIAFGDSVSNSMQDSAALIASAESGDGAGPTAPPPGRPRGNGDPNSGAGQCNGNGNTKHGC